MKLLLLVAVAALFRTASAQCSICEEGETLMNPDKMIPPLFTAGKFEEAASCGEVETAAQEDGIFSSAECILVGSFIAEVCGCAVPTDPPVTAPTDAPVAPPIDVSPVPVPTMAPVAGNVTGAPVMPETGAPVTPAPNATVAPTMAPVTAAPVTAAPTDAPVTAAPTATQLIALEEGVAVRLEGLNGELTIGDRRAFQSACTEYLTEAFPDVSDVACAILDQQPVRHLRALQSVIDVITSVTGSAETETALDGVVDALNEDGFLDALKAASESFAGLTAVTARGSDDPPPPTAPPPTAAPVVPTAPPPPPPTDAPVATTEAPVEAPVVAEDNDDGDDGLSGGAIFGIIIGVGAGVGALGAAAWFFLKQEGDGAENLPSEASRTIESGPREFPKPAVPAANPSALSSIEALRTGSGSIISRGEDGEASTIGDSVASLKNNYTSRTVVAPPGKLGIVIDTTMEGPVVNRVNPQSMLSGDLFPGDIIVGVDDIDTRAMSAAAITTLMGRTNTKKRTLTVLSADVTE